MSSELLLYLLCEQYCKKRGFSGDILANNIEIGIGSFIGVNDEGFEKSV